MRESRYSAVRAILEDNIRLRDRAQDRFQALFEKEVHDIHNAVRVEAEVCSCCFTCFKDFSCVNIHLLQVREREDDEIVEALNRYTLKLQNSLKVVNSTDM